jgi:restriction endonuclease S subunit
MRDNWTEITLNEVLLPVLNRALDNSEYEVLSVTEKRGIIPQTQVFNHRIATDDISKYKVLQPGDIAFNPYLLWCGAVGQWKGDYEGVVSPVYECFRVRETDSPRFVGLIFESGVLTPYFDSTAIGSIVRRRRTTLPVFYDAPIIRPPLAEQKRIVDVVSSVDAYIDALQHQVTAARMARNAVLHELLTGGSDDWTETTLGDVAEVLDRMRKPISAAEREKRPGKVPYYGATGQAGWIDKPIFDEELVLLGEDAIDFLNPNVHKAYLISGPSWVNNHAHVLKPRTGKVIPFFLMESLNAVDYSQFVAFGTRSKLTQGSMMGISVNLPPIAEQKRIVEIVSSMDDVIQAAERGVVEAKNLRSGLLSDLLSGEHEIPVSYDELLGAA